MHPKVCPSGKLGKDDNVVNTKSYEQMAAMDEKVERETSETNFVFYPPVKILLSTKKLLFCISHFQKEFHFF